MSSQGSKFKQPMTLSKYAIRANIVALVASLAAAGYGWKIVATGNPHLLHASPGYFWVQAMMFTFICLFHVPGLYALMKDNINYLRMYFFAAFATLAVTLPVGCYAMSQAFNHKDTDNFLDACIGSSFEDGHADACRTAVYELRIYVTICYVAIWLILAAISVLTWRYYTHLRNEVSVTIEEEEKAMLRPMSMASTRNSRISYGPPRNDRRASHIPRHPRRASSPTRAQPAQRASILRNSVSANDIHPGSLSASMPTPEPTPETSEEYYDPYSQENVDSNSSHELASASGSGSEHATMKPAPSRQVSYSEGPEPGQAPSRRVSFSDDLSPRTPRREGPPGLSHVARKTSFARVQGTSGSGHSPSSSKDEGDVTQSLMLNQH